MAEDKRRLEQKTKLIQELMDELEIPFLGGDGLGAARHIVRVLNKRPVGGGIDSKTLGYSVESDLAVFFTCQPDLTAIEIGEKTGEFMDALDEKVRGLHVVIFAQDMGEKWRTDRVLKASIKKQCRKLSSGQGENRESPTVVDVQCVLCPAAEVVEHSIYIESRPEFLRVPREAGPIGRREQRVFAHGSVVNQAEARVYTARLADVAELYNQIGDVLFSQNVRYRISDVLGVESEMKRTLREQPDDFWFFNNGITLMVRDPANIAYNCRDRLLLSQRDPGDLSVINGAQTICAAAEFLYGDMGADDEETERIRAAAREARVLLRVVSARNGQVLEKKEADQISIALNRQKPIANEDIAYTCSAVEQINELCESAGGGEPYFYILKRGENGRGKYCHKLNEFGRAVRAYRDQKPGQARSLGSREILGEKAGSIYADFDECGDRDALFRQWYKPVNFTIGAVELYSRWANTRAGEESDADGQAIAANGRYYFAAYLVRLLNGEERGTDFTAFGGKLARLDDGAFPLLEEYLAFFKDFFYLNQSEKGEEGQPTSNDFKGDELYGAWITYTQNKRRRKLQEWMKEVKRYFLDEAVPEE